MEIEKNNDFLKTNKSKEYTTCETDALFSLRKGKLEEVKKIDREIEKRGYAFTKAYIPPSLKKSKMQKRLITFTLAGVIGITGSYYIYNHYINKSNEPIKKVDITAIPDTNKEIISFGDEKGITITKFDFSHSELSKVFENIRARMNGIKIEKLIVFDNTVFSPNTDRGFLQFLDDKLYKNELYYVADADICVGYNLNIKDIVPDYIIDYESQMIKVYRPKTTDLIEARIYNLKNLYKEKFAQEGKGLLTDRGENFQNELRTTIENYMRNKLFEWYEAVISGEKQLEGQAIPKNIISAFAKANDASISTYTEEMTALFNGMICKPEYSSLKDFQVFVYPNYCKLEN